jgi:sugar phosphate isomerase/epimerase
LPVLQLFAEYVGSGQTKAYNGNQQPRKKVDGMQCSVWSSYFHTFTPEEMVDAFLRKGWSCSELSDEHGAALLERGHPEIVGRQFRQYAADRGFTFPQGHLWLTCDIASPNRQAVVDTLKKWLELFDAVGITAAVLHPASSARYRAGHDPAAIEADCASVLRELAEFLNDSNLTICLENLFSHAATCDDLFRMIKAAGENHLGICLDTGHLNLAGRDQAGFIRQAGSWLKALHIADNQGQTDQHLMPFGVGTIDWPPVMAALREIHYDGLFNYEIPGERHAPLPVLEAKLDYLQEVTRVLLQDPAGE